MYSMATIKNDLTGKTIGFWTVIEDLGVQARKKGNRRGNRYWLCRCQCGTTKPVQAQTLLNGTSRKCVKCGQQPVPYSEELSECVWNKIVRSASKRSIEMQITKQQAFCIFVRQGRKCALTGLDIHLPENGTEERHLAYTASLDRIDSKKDYTTDNVQWVHKHINRMKNVFEQEYFVQMCRLVAGKTNVRKSSDTPSESSDANRL
jgi:hypothetical protein